MDRSNPYNLALSNHYTSHVPQASELPYTHSSHCHIPTKAPFKSSMSLSEIHQLQTGHYQQSSYESQLSQTSFNYSISDNYFPPANTANFSRHQIVVHPNSQGSHNKKHIKNYKGQRKETKEPLINILNFVFKKRLITIFRSLANIERRDNYITKAGKPIDIILQLQTAHNNEESWINTIDHSLAENISHNKVQNLSSRHLYGLQPSKKGINIISPLFLHDKEQKTENIKGNRQNRAENIKIIVPDIEIKSVLMKMKNKGGVKTKLDEAFAKRCFEPECSPSVSLPIPLQRFNANFPQNEGKEQDKQCQQLLKNIDQLNRYNGQVLKLGKGLINVQIEDHYKMKPDKQSTKNKSKVGLEVVSNYNKPNQQTVYQRQQHPQTKKIYKVTHQILEKQKSLNQIVCPPRTNNFQSSLKRIEHYQTIPLKVNDPECVGQQHIGAKKTNDFLRQQMKVNTTANVNILRRDQLTATQIPIKVKSLSNSSKQSFVAAPMSPKIRFNKSRQITVHKILQPQRYYVSHNNIPSQSPQTNTPRKLLRPQLRYKSQSNLIKGFNDFSDKNRVTQLNFENFQQGRTNYQNSIRKQNYYMFPITYMKKSISQKDLPTVYQLNHNQSTKTYSVIPHHNLRPTSIESRCVRGEMPVGRNPQLRLNRDSPQGDRYYQKIRSPQTGRSPQTQRYLINPNYAFGYGLF